MILGWDIDTGGTLAGIPAPDRCDNVPDLDCGSALGFTGLSDGRHQGQEARLPVVRHLHQRRAILLLASKAELLVYEIRPHEAA